MLTPFELQIILSSANCQSELQQLQKDFVAVNPVAKVLADNEFMTLLMLAPSVGVALANGSVSLFEEISLSKKAQRLLPNTHFLNKDPLTDSLKALIVQYHQWEDPILNFLKRNVIGLLKENTVVWKAFKNPENSTGNLGRDLMNAPCLFVKFLGFSFCESEKEIVSRKSLTQAEYDKIREIGRRLELLDVSVFQLFCSTIDVHKIQ